MTQPNPPATAATGSPEPAAPPAAAVDYDALLNEIPPDVLLRHRRVGGILGNRAEQIAQGQRARDREADKEKADRERREQMRELAKSNPFQFAATYLDEDQKIATAQEFSDLEAKTQRQILEQIGAAYGQVPEWKELTQSEFGEVAARTQGLAGAELIAAFNTAALDKVAEKRAGKRVQSEVASRLKTEREAWERESAAARLRGEQPPDLSRPGAPSRFDPSQLSDEQFNQWYMTEGPGRNI